MKERFKQLPETLQRQVMIRAVGGIVFLILLIVMQLSFKDIYLSLPCVLFGLVTIVNGGRCFIIVSVATIFVFRGCASRLKQLVSESG